MDRETIQSENENRDSALCGGVDVSKSGKGLLIPGKEESLSRDAEGNHPGRFGVHFEQTELSSVGTRHF